MILQPYWQGYHLLRLCRNGKPQHRMSCLELIKICYAV